VQENAGKIKTSNYFDTRKYQSNCQKSLLGFLRDNSSPENTNQRDCEVGHKKCCQTWHGQKNCTGRL